MKSEVNKKISYTPIPYTRLALEDPDKERFTAPAKTDKKHDDKQYKADRERTAFSNRSVSTKDIGNLSGATEGVVGGGASAEGIATLRPTLSTMNTKPGSRTLAERSSAVEGAVKENTPTPSSAQSTSDGTSVLYYSSRNTPSTQSNSEGTAEWLESSPDDFMGDQPITGAPLMMMADEPQEPMSPVRISFDVKKVFEGFEKPKPDAPKPPAKVDDFSKFDDFSVLAKSGYTRDANGLILPSCRIKGGWPKTPAKQPAPEPEQPEEIRLPESPDETTRISEGSTEHEEIIIGQPEPEPEQPPEALKLPEPLEEQAKSEVIITKKLSESFKANKAPTPDEPCLTETPTQAVKLPPELKPKDLKTPEANEYPLEPGLEVAPTLKVKLPPGWKPKALKTPQAKDSTQPDIIYWRPGDQEKTEITRKLPDVPEEQEKPEATTLPDVPKEHETPEAADLPKAPVENDHSKPTYQVGTNESPTSDEPDFNTKVSKIFADPFEDPEAFLPSIGAALLEGSAATAFSLYRRHKIKHRRHNINAAHKVVSDSLNIPMHRRKLPVDLDRFKDLIRLSFVANPGDVSEEAQPLITVFKSHKTFQKEEGFTQLLTALATVFPDDTALLKFKSLISKAFLANAEDLSSLQKVLKPYGITIEYQKVGALKHQVTDKFRTKKNEKSQPCLHRTVIDKMKLFDKLEDDDALPTYDHLIQLVTHRKSAIKTLYKLRNYDDWKLAYTNHDTKMKVGAAALGIVPVLPLYDSARAVAYHQEKSYRIQNRKHIEERIKTSFDVLEAYKEAFSTDDYQRISDSLNNLIETKFQHIRLKQERAKAMKVIHIGSAMVTPASAVAGPIGSGIRSGVRGAAKIAATVAPAVQRYRNDKKQQKDNTFSTTQGIYELYKGLYQRAKAEGDQKLQKAVEHLAYHSFDLRANEFESLTNTSLVEDRHFKLSFARPTGENARAT